MGDSSTHAVVPDLRALAELLGIECEHVDGRGHVRHATDDMLRMTLQALGLNIQSDVDVQREWERIKEERWTNVIEPVLLHYPEARTSLSFPITLPLGDHSLETLAFECQLKDEDGNIRLSKIKGTTCVLLEETELLGTRYGRIQVTRPGRLRFGYYQLDLMIKIDACVLKVQSCVIAAPQRCYLPPGSTRRWGIGVQLYGVRSRDNWGIGDFGDLERILKKAGQTWKASTIGLQPLHSLTPGLCSPYSPSSRLCWNPLYLNLEHVAEFRLSSKVQRMFRTKKFRAKLDRLRSCSLVEYDAVEALKMAVLEDLFRAFKRYHLQAGTARGRAFLQFVKQSPTHLTRFCIFQVLHEYFHGVAWRQWPSVYQCPLSPEVEAFQHNHATRMQYFYYVQWLCEQQLSRLDHIARTSSLSLGLYHDLPVGIHPDGADAWAFQEQLAKDVTIGAPPDTFNLQGQNWGLLAPNPRALRQHGYNFFRQTLSQNMKHGGVLRIDHALGLFRMYWVPFGHSGRDGLYVKTYVDELLAVLAIESVRHQVMVVGEDLGTVTPAIHRKLEAAGLLSYRLLLFEREEDGMFHAPSDYPAQALVAATTHDLPTLKGYWAGRDIEMKDESHLYPLPEDGADDRRTRGQDLRQLWESLRSVGIALPETRPDMLSPDVISKIYQFLAQTPSRLLMVQLEDLLGELDTPNLPGAAESAYPSWRMRLGRELDAWLKDPASKGFAQLVSRERRRRPVSSSLASP
mgnify:CR=1 FL=1